MVTMSSLFLGTPLTPHLVTSFLNGPYDTSFLIWIWDIFKTSHKRHLFSDVLETSQRRHVKDVFLEIIWDTWKMSQKRHLSWDAFETSQKRRLFFRCLWDVSLNGDLIEMSRRRLMPAGLWIFTSVKRNLAAITTL